MAHDTLTSGTHTLAGKAAQDGFISVVQGSDGTSPERLATETTLEAARVLIASIAAAIKAEDSTHISGDMGIPLLALRSSSDTVTTSNDGDYTNLKIDEEGRLKVSSKSASFAPVTGSLTTVAQTVVCDVSRASNISFHVKNTGSVTLAAGTFVFEASLDSTNGTDGTWFGVQVARSNANTTELQIALSGMTASAGFTTAWECSVNAYQWFRIRCSVAVTASAIATWTIQRGTYATEPVPIIQVTGTQPVSGSVTAAVAAATLAPPTIVADVASAALTTTTTTAAVTPTAGASYEVVIPVTVVSGTTPTLDIGVEESDDTGTNWFRVYDFPRITATGIYRSPKLPLTGNRVRYVQTVTGTTPSFTRAINRLQSQEGVSAIRQLIDRTLASTQTLNAVTGSLNVQNCRAVQLLVTAGTITTTAPALQLEGSDDNGLTWYAIGNPLTAVASSTVRAITVDANSQLIRARVSTAGASATLTYVLLKGF